LAGVAAAFEQFGIRCLELCRPNAAVIKPQAAFFELAGPWGMSAMQAVLRRARELGYLTILDAKRGDIASTAAAYAEAAFRGCRVNGETIPVWDADALTVNPYLGEDAVMPFVETARAQGRGVFILVRTSNSGAGLFQDRLCEGRQLHHHVAEAVNRWQVGAVVGATAPQELAQLRSLMPDAWFLVPGYGAQGATANDVRSARRADGLGAVINSSRGITFPFKPDDPKWETKIVAAAAKAQAELM
jgi:orotidine-5'-phosphate decarboxylase